MVLIKLFIIVHYILDFFAVNNVQNIGILLIFKKFSVKLSIANRAIQYIKLRYNPCNKNKTHLKIT